MASTLRQDASSIPACPMRQRWIQTAADYEFIATKIDTARAVALVSDETLPGGTVIEG